MEITFSKIKMDEFDSTFNIFREYLKPAFADAFGWDEECQKRQFVSRLQPEWFSWILSNNAKIGLQCSRVKPNSLHLHLLIIFSQAQRQGFASLATQMLTTEAHSKELNLTLSCLKNNMPALRLYRTSGFEVNSEDEYFFFLVKKFEST